jgi:hypothetical protein
MAMAMAKLIGHSVGYLMIICESGKDLTDLAKEAGLLVATECRCGKCGLGSGQRGFVDGQELLDKVIDAHGDLEYLERYHGQGLYLVSRLGHSPVGDTSMLAAVCSPIFRRRRWNFEVGLNFRDGSGSDIPKVAHYLAEVVKSS